MPHAGQVLALERLATDLVEAGRLSADALDRAKRVQRQSGERLDVILTRLGLASEQDIVNGLSSLLGIPIVSREQFPEAPILESQLGRKFLRQAKIVPLADEPDRVILAMADPLNDTAVDAAGFAVRKTIERRIACPADIEFAFEKLYSNGKSQIGEIAGSTETHTNDVTTEDVERLRDIASEAPIVRIVNLVITRAVEARASDIHIEAGDGALRVRYRIDGVLQEIQSPPAHMRAAIISRLKIMARLNIAERRLAQDGRITLAVRGKDIDLRVATTPTIFGEGVVLRILDRSTLPLDFRSLGIEGELQRRFVGALDRPHGILLVTGPTGSGKTTTLYASLLSLNTVGKKLLTVEDPVEYQLQGVNQLQVKPHIGLTFANALRSFLRQDPDIMMVGEIRDLETAQIAVQAALTGHLLLSTLHTNNAASAITRLLDMGVEDYLLNSTINALAAQRLVRKLCVACRKPHEILPELIDRLGLGAMTSQRPIVVFRAVGCDHCSRTGYFGRTSILELLPMTDAIRQLIMQHAEARVIEKLAIEQGMEPMFMHGMRKVLAGVTTTDEVLRATRDSE